MVHVHSCWDDGEAEVVVSFLASEGIEAATSSSVAHTVYPTTTDGMAEVRIFVAEEDAGRARELLAEHQGASGE